MTIAWPIDTLIPAKITRHIAPRTTAGTVSASGFTQRVSAPAHAWVIEYEGIPVGSAATLAAWDALEAQLDGGANAVLVYLPSEAYQAAPDGTLNGAAVAGDTTITISRADTIAPGYHFSVGERLYRAFAVTDLGGGDFDVQFRPPLREDLADTTAVVFSTLVCKCRLATDDEMKLSIDSARIGFGAVKFVEDPSE